MAMPESQETILPPDSPEVQILKQYTQFYEEEYAKEFARTFPEFSLEQSKKAMALAHKLALDRARERVKIESEGGKDALTELDNRKRFAEDGRIEIANAIREGKKISIIFVDIDHFKLVNDDSSHATGDEVLRQVAQNLSNGRRTGDRLARLGGEEFLGLIKLDEDKSIAAAERWRKNLETSRISYVTNKGETRQITISIGVATFDPGSISENRITNEIINRELNNVVRKADMAMYCAKENRRNKVGIARADGSFATLDPKENGSGNTLTVRTTPNKPPTDDYFKT